MVLMYLFTGWCFLTTGYTGPKHLPNNSGKKLNNHVAITLAIMISELLIVAIQWCENWDTMIIEKMRFQQ